MKRRSAGRIATQLRLESFVIFLDENHCNNTHILRVLAEEQVAVERHLAHFQPGELDEVWLRTVGANGWILVTTDQRIRRRELEKTALLRAGVRSFVFTSNNLAGPVMAELLRRALPAMKQLVVGQDPPFIASITKQGAVHLLFDRKGNLHGRS